MQKKTEMEKSLTPKVTFAKFEEENLLVKPSGNWDSNPALQFRSQALNPFVTAAGKAQRNLGHCIPDN